MGMNIVFDFGAVLFDWRPDQLVAAQFPAQAATPHAARALARDIFHHDDWQDFDRGVVELADVIARTAARLGLPQQQMSELMSGIGERLTPIDASVQLLSRLRNLRDGDGGLRLFYLSNMPAPYARVLERRHGFLSWFDGGVFSGDVKMAKPQREIFALLGSRYALSPEQTLFVDDMDVNVDAARAFGWQAVRFESADHLLPHLPLR